MDDDALLFVAGFFFGAAASLFLEQLAYRVSPAVNEAELIAESEAVIIAAERELRRHG